MIFGITQLLIILFFIAYIVVYFIFNTSISSSMNTISPQNRKMEGGMIWLNLIPGLNLVWPFIFNNAIKHSFTDEFRLKKIPKEVNLTLGLIYPIAPVIILVLTIVNSILFISFVQEIGYHSGLFEFTSFMQLIQFVFTVAGFIMKMIYWSQVNGLRDELVNYNNKMYYESISGKNQVVREEVTIQPKRENTTVESTIVEPLISNETKQVSSYTKPQVNYPPTQETAIDKLKKYHEMLNEGLITQEDFDQIKRDLLKNN